ncbi:MAG TPA: hypothetical protein VHM92_00380 [Allosphingosinicella sp.]|nr:hypothetical protein [Allosphingosinicella sp.]
MAIIIVGLATVTALVLAYKFMPGFRFWCFDIWADLPVIGTTARRSRMRNPTTETANARLDELFHAYLLHMPTPIREKDFDRIRSYLFLSCDSQSKPTPAIAWGLLSLLICAESYAFSFLLGVSLSGDMSQNRADIVAIGIAFILGLVLLILAHMSGHQLRRTHELRAARRHMIDTSAALPPNEKSLKELLRRVSLEDEQVIDEPRESNFESQRFLNRVIKSDSDDGNYLLPALFIIAVLLIALGQYKLRNVMMASGIEGQNAAPEWANALFVLIFLMTQGLALMFGYKYGFLGRDSERAYQIIGGRNTFADYQHERDPMIRRADETLTSLYAKMRSRYTQVRPELLSFMERFHREEALQKKAEAPAKIAANETAAPAEVQSVPQLVTPIRDSAG